LVTGLALAVAAAGCATTGADRSANATASLKDLKKEALTMRAQIDKTLESLNALQSADDVKESFNDFAAQVDDVGSDADTMKDQADDMKARLDDYVKKWQEDMAQVTDPSLKAISAQRQAAVKQRIGEIQARQQAAAQAFKAFYGDLTGLRSFLSNDLTPDGIKAAGPTIKKANEDRATLKHLGDELISVLDQVSAGLSSSKPTK
jgi:chromosome segregation ATPase